MKILICGSRTWTKKDIIMQVIKEIGPSVIIEGGCGGADALAKECAKELLIVCREYPAEWKVYGREAGPLRNKLMIEEERPSLVVAFANNLLKSPGTKNMLMLAKKYYIPTRHYNSLGILQESI